MRKRVGDFPPRASAHLRRGPGHHRGRETRSADPRNQLALPPACPGPQSPCKARQRRPVPPRRSPSVRVCGGSPRLPAVDRLPSATADGSPPPPATPLPSAVTPSQGTILCGAVCALSMGVLISLVLFFASETPSLIRAPLELPLCSRASYRTSKDASVASTRTSSPMALRPDHLHIICCVAYLLT